jgi:Raf kinase inhibitor-like YbhB/YbcL family protein
MFVLTSPEIVEQGIIAVRYTNGGFGVEGGQNISPPIAWEDAPSGTKSFALACVDPDVPLEAEWFPYKEQLKVGMLPGDLFIHWLVCDIPASVKSLAEGASPNKLPSGAKELATSYTPFGLKGYGGAAPPKGHKAHRYIFTLYALSVDTLRLSSGSGYIEFINAMKGKVLATSSLTAYFGHY